MTPPSPVLDFADTTKLNIPRCQLRCEVDKKTNESQNCASVDSASNASPSSMSDISYVCETRLEEGEDDEYHRDAFAVVHMRDINTLVSFYEGLLRQSINTDAFHAVSKITLDLKDLKLCHAEYPKDMQGALGDRLYIAACLTDYCVVCLSLVPHHENIFLKIICPTCQAVEFCSGFCSLETNTHPCRLLSKLKVMSRCKDTDLETYRIRKNMVIERANMLEANHAEAIALDAQKEDLLRRREAAKEITQLHDSNAQTVLTESDQYIMAKLQPICNILGLTRKLYTKKDNIFLKNLAESSFSIADLRVKDPFTYAFILKIAFLFSNGMSKVQQEKEKLTSVLKEIRKMSAEFDFNYNLLHQTLTDLRKLMVTASNGGTDLASVQNTYQACKDILKITDKAKLPEQCKAALTDIRKVVYFWNEIRMSNHLIDALNRYSDLVKGIIIHEERKKVLQQESSNLSDQIRTCQESIVEANLATSELKARLDKLKLGIFPSTGPSPAIDTGAILAIEGSPRHKDHSNENKSYATLKGDQEKEIDIGKVTPIHRDSIVSIQQSGQRVLSHRDPLSSNAPSTSVIKNNADMFVKLNNMLPVTTTQSTKPLESILSPTKVVVQLGDKDIPEEELTLSGVLTPNVDPEVQGLSQEQSARASRHGLENMRSFSDVLNNVENLSFVPSSPPPPLPPPPVLSEPQPESLPAEACTSVKKSILEDFPIPTPSVSHSMPSDAPPIKESSCSSQPSHPRSHSPVLARSNATLVLQRAPPRSLPILSADEGVITSESDPLRIANAVRSVVSRSQSIVEPIQESAPHAGEEELTTTCSPVFGDGPLESITTLLQASGSCHHLKNSSNMHSAQSTSLTTRCSEHDTTITNEQASAIHIISRNQSHGSVVTTTTSQKSAEAVLMTARTMTTTPVINSIITKQERGPVSATFKSSSHSEQLDANIRMFSFETSCEDSFQQSIDKKDLPVQVGDPGHRSLSSRYRNIHSQLEKRRSLFNKKAAAQQTETAKDQNTPQQPNIDAQRKDMDHSQIPPSESRYLLDLKVTTANSSVVAHFNKPPENSKLSTTIKLSLPKVSQYLDDYTTSMYTTEVIFLIKVWKTMAHSLLLLNRINDYFTRKAVASGETYVDRIIGKYEEEIVKRIYTYTQSRFLNIRFEYYEHKKLCFLRLNMSIGTGKSCKWKSSDEVLKFTMSEDQYKRLKQTNALRVNTRKMNCAQRTALYESLKDYVLINKPINPDAIIHAK